MGFFWPPESLLQVEPLSRLILPMKIQLPFCCALIGLSALRAQEIINLPDTQPLKLTGDLSAQMHEAALRDMDRKIAESVTARQQFWHRDVSSPEKYAASIAANREHFRQIIGLVDQRVPVTLERFGNDANPALVAETPTYRIFQVRWPVLDRVTGEGLLLEPKGRTAGFVVALPDADQTPEQLAGLSSGTAADSQFARRLVENGFTVIVPVLMDRGTAGSGNPAVLMTNMPHREWIHRQAWMMGRSVIGYEVQKVLALVDWIKGLQGEARVAVAGYGEGGLIAFYAAAADPRLDAAWVSGYFRSRQQTWAEPLYRDVWGLLREFGDAEIASLISPRPLVVEYSEEPRVEGPPPSSAERKNCAAPGKLQTPPFDFVEAEFRRIDSLVPPGFQDRRLAHTREVPQPPGGQESLADFAEGMGFLSPMGLSAQLPLDQRHAVDPAARQLAQGRELEDYTQKLILVSHHTRDDFFLHKLLPESKNEPWTYAQFPAKQAAAAEAFTKGARDYKPIFWEEVLGKLDDPLPLLNPRTRKIYDTPQYTGYDVVLDTGKEGFAWGVILLPKDLKPGEKRPVVVCQHGRHGLPKDVIEGDVPAYHNFAARLAEQGYIVLAPHNLYQKEAYYRMLARKGHTVKASLFSVILRHHQQWLKWLATLPQVDPQRIAFYGLSFGGESAVRIPPLLDGYCLSICSGDFNDWTRKIASTDDRHSFMFTDEWEIACFNMGNTFNYAELTYLMFPRPFMVERGHHDGVSIDSWVASEYAKTRWLYDQFGMGDRTRIEFFNGGHTINGQGTFEFLREQLGWAGK
jgi:dienelactone hydrolase